MGRDIVRREEVEAEVAARHRPGARQDRRNHVLPNPERVPEHLLDILQILLRRTRYAPSRSGLDSLLHLTWRVGAGQVHVAVVAIKAGDAGKLGLGVAAARECDVQAALERKQEDLRQLLSVRQGELKLRLRGQDGPGCPDSHGVGPAAQGSCDLPDLLPRQGVAGNVLGLNGLVRGLEDLVHDPAGVGDAVDILLLIGEDVGYQEAAESLLGWERTLVWDWVDERGQALHEGLSEGPVG